MFVGWPVVALIIDAVHGAGISRHVGWQWQNAPRLFLNIIIWCALITAGAVVTGYIPGIVLGRQRSVLMTAVLVASLCIPGYIVYYAWGLLRLPGTALGDWIAMDRMRSHYARLIQAYLGLVVWVWPAFSLCVAVDAARLPRRFREAVLMETSALSARMRLAIRETLFGAFLGMGVVFSLLLGSFVVFHLAGIPIYAIQLEMLRALTPGSKELALAALPLIILACVMAGLLLAGLNRISQSPLPVAPARSPKSALAWAWIISLLTFVGPVAMMIYSLGSLEALHSGLVSSGGVSALLQSSISALLTAAFVFLTCLGLMIGWTSSSEMMRTLTTIEAFFWFAASFVPGTIVAMGLGAAYNNDVTGFFYDSRFMTVFGHVARFSLPAVVLAKFAAARFPADLRDIQQMQGATSLRGWLFSSGPFMLMPAVLAAIFAAVLSLGEVAVSVVLSPPGSTSLGVTLLNQLHYAHDEVVMVTCLILFIAVLLGMIFTLGGWRIFRRLHGNLSLILLCLLMAVALPGCEKKSNSTDFLPDLVFGSAGYGEGQFAYPRALALDRQNQWIYVVDKAGRVQRFDYEGKFLNGWTMPAIDRGKPVGLTVSPQGELFVADTHENRVVVFTPQGKLLRSFGSYGRNPGEFLYTTDIAFLSDGRLVVGEYGSNDRITVLSPTEKVLNTFGRFGFAEDNITYSKPQTLVLNRPQCLHVSPDGKTIWIVDACNHRLVHTDLQGNLLGTIGSPGRGSGQLWYPYSMDFLADGTIIVCEFGNSRLQRFTTDGKSLAIYGEPGRSEGEFASPWAVAADKNTLYVLDSRNNRVQRFRMNNMVMDNQSRQ